MKFVAFILSPDQFFLKSICAFLFQDANVKLIRELREEIDRLKAMLMSFELVCSNIYLNVNQNESFISSVSHFKSIIFS